jgi:hypothetical protein
MVSIYTSVVQYQLIFILDLGINMRLINLTLNPSLNLEPLYLIAYTISSIYAKMLVWVQGLSYYIMVSSTRNVINYEHISTLLYNVSQTLKQPREYPCSNAKCHGKLQK